MAVSKIHPIRRTLNKAIDYIVNPKKTADELFISTFGCMKETAADEFLLTKRLGNEHCFTLAQHVIQSFKPGEVSPKLAHEIGVKLANELTHSQHEYVIATHVDKDHIHNHIIFNHTNFVTHKAFRSNMKTVRELRQLSDKLCKEYGLSIIENPQKKGMTKYEWMMKKKGLSYKKQLQDNIDICINASNSFGEFLINMQKLGYEIKRGKHIAFRKNKEERFTRVKSFGEEYTEDSIKERIASHPTVRCVTSFSFDSSLGLIKNVENYLSFADNPIYRQKVSLSNSKKISATYNYLVKNGIDSLSSLDDSLYLAKEECSAVFELIKVQEKQLRTDSEMAKHIKRLNEYAPVYKKYSVSDDPDSFRDKHRTEIMLYEASARALKQLADNKPLPASATLEKRISDTQEKNRSLYAKLNRQREKIKELETVKKNISMIFENRDIDKREHILQR